MQQIGVVIIGRNEGERLKRSIGSVQASGGIIVYVDSGSTDGSVEFVQEQKLHLVELDTSIPFSAGRARNEGMNLLVQHYPDMEYIQFVDGDCEVCPEWLEHACHRLEEDKALAIVCGRRRERFPERSIYNHLCDIEWNTPVGPAISCGGDSMARVSALKEVNGFNPSVIAGEEPDLCYRLRAAGWHIERLDYEMTLHDAQIFYFSQWWKRALRSGHAYAQTMTLHWGDAERFNVRNVGSIIFWGAIMPIIFLIALWNGMLLTALLVLGIFLVMANRISNYLMRVRGFGKSESRLYGIFTMIGKAAQVCGVIQFFYKWLTSSDLEIIEYKR